MDLNTFEGVDLHVDANHEAAMGAVENKDLPGVWRVARPILNMVANFPLLPAKWRAIVAGLVATVDAVTGNAQ